MVLFFTKHGIQHRVQIQMDNEVEHGFILTSEMKLPNAESAEGCLYALTVSVMYRRNVFQADCQCLPPCLYALTVSVMSRRVLVRVDCFCNVQKGRPSS